MWIADKWNEYEILDTSGGEKCELWSDYKLIRPDPQVIWNTKKGEAWKKPNAHYHRSSKGGGEWEFFDLPEQWEITYSLGSSDKGSCCHRNCSWSSLCQHLPSGLRKRRLQGQQKKYKV